MARSASSTATSRRFPRDDATTEQHLLQLFLLEKAGYEIAYEAANRPTWIDVPLHGMAQLVTQLIGEKVPS